ncbi:exodeoxyribonuclease VII large subunit [Candidatus Zixiibacteriota bacterium]
MGLIEDKVLSVTEITREIKSSLEEDYSGLWIEGEISNFKRHTSGHLYFSLKDSNATLRCVMWRGTAAYLQFEPEDGAKVRAFGDITVYERHGAYQLRVGQMIPQGVGELEIAFRKLKEKLAAEGLFDQEHKKEIPAWPATIGVITSPTGAAVRDIIVTLQRRWPPIRIVLRPSAVQGVGAAEQIAEAIEDFNQWGQADLLIVGRGGGSLEDLWAFNEEILARAVFHSHIPIVSAVGHEIDYTICDFVADGRAPTPTAAAEMVVPDVEEVQRTLGQAIKNITALMTQKVAHNREIVDGFRGRYGMRRVKDMVFQKSQYVDELERGLNAGMRRIIEHLRAQVSLFSARLDALSPHAVLKRGYSITRTYPDNQLLTSAAETGVGATLRTILAWGSVTSEVIGTKIPELSKKNEK